jgi:flagellar protein FlaG
MEVQKVEALAEELNTAFEEIGGNVSVSVDDTTGMVVVRITDSATGEIVKQIPPQQLLDADINMDKIIGILVDDLA